MAEGRVFVRAYEQREGDARVTVLETAAGGKELRIGGSPAWRNHNPGNLRSSRFNKEQIGVAWGFAVFPNEEAGLRAMKDLLARPLYAKLTLEKAIYKYAPPSDNNPSYAYAKFVSSRADVRMDEVLGTLGRERMVAVILAMVAFERSVGGAIKTVTS